MLFSFEGIDGSGKSTQARRLAASLRERGVDVVEVREPGGTDLGERVRALLLDPYQHVDPRAELLLFSAARAQLVSSVVAPALDRGAVVVADRFTDSSTVYQGAGRDLADVDWIESLHRFATAGLAPHRTYLIDLDVSDAARRRRGQPSDRMENAGRPFYESVRAAYLRLAATAPQRVLTLDGHRTEDDLARHILSDALDAMSERTE